MSYSGDRHCNQRAKILELLRERGARGVLNVELYRLCFRPPSRLCELRQSGYAIETRREGEGLFRYVLISEPAPPRTYAEHEREMQDQHAPLFAATTERP